MQPSHAWLSRIATKISVTKTLFSKLDKPSIGSIPAEKIRSVGSLRKDQYGECTGTRHTITIGCRTSSVFLLTVANLQEKEIPHASYCIYANAMRSKTWPSSAISSPLVISGRDPVFSARRTERAFFHNVLKREIWWRSLNARPPSHWKGVLYSKWATQNLLPSHGKLFCN